jgi:hypothetical protein
MPPVRLVLKRGARNSAARNSPPALQHARNTSSALIPATCARVIQKCKMSTICTATFCSSYFWHLAHYFQGSPSVNSDSSCGTARQGFRNHLPFAASSIPSVLHPRELSKLIWLTHNTKCLGLNLIDQEQQDETFRSPMSRIGCGNGAMGPWPGMVYWSGVLWQRGGGR